MVFNSFLFLFIFLPLLLIGWFGLNKVSTRGADLFLIGMSLWFYGCFGVEYLFILLISILMNYLVSRGIQNNRKRLIIGIVMNLALLCLFKYVTPALSSFSGEEINLPSFLTLAIPVGLSFYTFTQMTFLIDGYRGEIQEEDFVSYLLYVTYFPKLAEGPISKYGEIMSQFRSGTCRHVNWENLTRGCFLFFLGMGKKILLADTLAPVATYGIESAYYLDTLSVLLTMTCYTLQLYFDFSGFCDMAMGISLMLNIHLPLNFDAPFRAASFSGFWRRWHMTLTRFFTQYIYIPLGGNKKGTLRTCINVMFIFILSGIWHGTGANYLVWGGLCGLFVIAGNLFQKKHKTMANVHSGFRIAINFILFSVSMIFFAAPNLTYSTIILSKIVDPRYPGWLYRMAGQLDCAEFWLINKAVSMLIPSYSNLFLLTELMLVVVFSFIVLTRRRTALQLSMTMKLSGKNAVWMGILIVWCLASISGVSTYVYFQF